MMKRRVRAFTVMEVTIALMISSIVILMTWTAFQQVSRYLIRQNEEKKIRDSYWLIRRALDQDTDRAKAIFLKDEELHFMMDSSRIVYRSDRQRLIREVSRYDVRDTFLVPVLQLEGTPIAGDPQRRLSALSLKIMLADSTSLNISTRKIYSSMELMESYGDD